MTFIAKISVFVWASMLSAFLLNEFYDDAVAGFENIA